MTQQKAVQEAERRFSPENGQQWDYMDARLAFISGYDRALQEFAPLIEAARAYRDAAERYSTGRPHRSGVPLDALLEAENALHMAARTLEGVDAHE